MMDICCGTRTGFLSWTRCCRCPSSRIPAADCVCRRGSSPSPSTHRNTGSSFTASTKTEKVRLLLHVQQTMSYSETRGNNQTLTFTSILSLKTERTLKGKTVTNEHCHTKDLFTLESFGLRVTVMVSHQVKLL